MPEHSRHYSTSEQQMDISIVKVALIGCGRIAGHHCDSIAETAGATLVAVCDLDFSKAVEYSEKYGVNAYSNYREMLKAHPDINTVAVITPSGMHYEHSKEILENFNRNLIIEKPTFMNVGQLSEIFDIAEERGLQIFPVFQNRYNKAVDRVKKGIELGELGTLQIISVRVRWCRPQRYYDLAPWRGTFALDGGALTNQGIHHIDLMRLFGGEVEKVSASMATFGVDVEVEDTVVATVLFQSGAVGTIEVTTAARFDDFEASISLVGNKGLAQIGGKAVNELEIYTPDGDACAEFSEDFTGSVYGSGHKVLYSQITEYFDSGKSFSVDRADNQKTIEFLNAIYLSDERSSWVTVSESEDSSRLGRLDTDLMDLYRTKDE